MSYSYEYIFSKTAPIWTKEMGRRLYYARRKMGLDQKQLGSRLGVSGQTVSKLEQGKILICHVSLGVFKSALSPHWLFVFDGAGSERYPHYRPLTNGEDSDLDDDA